MNDFICDKLKRNFNLQDIKIKIDDPHYKSKKVVIYIEKVRKSYNFSEYFLPIIFYLKRYI